MANCRKIIFISKAALVTGVLWLLAVAVGAVDFAPLSLICALSLTIFGIVSFGSNVSTLRQISEAIEKAEARRAELISSIDLRLVGNA